MTGKQPVDRVVVWSEEQLNFVRYLTTRIAKAEDAVDRVRDLADDLEAVAKEYNHVPPGTHDAGARNAHFAIARRIHEALDPEDQQ